MREFFPNLEIYQKQPPRGVLKKRCSDIMHQIYRRTPLPKSDFNKVAKQIYINHTSAWVFSCKFAAYFQNSFSEEQLSVTASIIYCRLLIALSIYSQFLIAWISLLPSSSKQNNFTKYKYRQLHYKTKTLKVWNSIQIKLCVTGITNFLPFVGNFGSYKGLLSSF